MHYDYKVKSQKKGGKKGAKKQKKRKQENKKNKKENTDRKGGINRLGQPDRKISVFLTTCLYPIEAYIQKAESPGSPDSANYSEFSAKILDEHAKTSKFVLFAGLIQYLFPNYVKLFLKS